MSDYNARIIAEFRANAGKVGGPFEGHTLLLLHSTGAKSGEERVNPVAYQDLGGPVAIFASKGGAPEDPAWFHNVVANPDVEVEIGTTRQKRRARVAGGAERAEIFERQKIVMPGFADYESRTAREIPVVVLDPVSE